MFEQETEKQALKSVLVEERSRYCLFVACLKPVMVRSIIESIDLVLFLSFFFFFCLFDLVSFLFIYLYLSKSLWLCIDVPESAVVAPIGNRLND